MHEKKIPAIFSGAEKKETKKISSDFKWNKELFISFSIKNEMYRGSGESFPATFSGAEKKETKKISSDFKWNRELFIPFSIKNEMYRGSGESFSATFSGAEKTFPASPEFTYFFHISDLYLRHPFYIIGRTER